MTAAKSSMPDEIENVESSSQPARARLERDRTDMTRQILFKLDTRCVKSHQLSSHDQLFPLTDEDIDINTLVQSSPRPGPFILVFNAGPNKRRQRQDHRNGERLENI